MNDYRELVESFHKAKVLVLGDVMLDRYWWGKVERISPEAPVPIVLLERTFETAGGAANVAVNVAGLGADVFLIGLVGDDGEGETLKKILVQQGVHSEFLKDDKRGTTVKTRVVAHSQHVVRVDNEQVIPLNEEQERTVLEMVQSKAKEVDILIGSDYAKGFFTEKLLSRLITLSKEVQRKIVIDPKGPDFSKYYGATAITPNQKEALEACRKAADTDEAGKMLLEELNLECVLITQGERGMTLFEKHSKRFLSASARKVYDVTGAGDTVIATFATAIACGACYKKAAEIANIAAGLVVEEVGTTAIKKENLLRHTDRLSRADV